MLPIVSHQNVCMYICLPVYVLVSKAMWVTAGVFVYLRKGELWNDLVGHQLSLPR